MLDRFWTTVGKLSVLLGVILASVSIYRSAYPATASVQAECSCQDFELPPSLLEKLRVSPAQQDSQPTQAKLTPSPVTPKALWFQHDNPYDGFCVLVVKSTGTLEAKDIVLEARFSGVAAIGPNDEVIEREQQIPADLQLGSLRPGNELVVKLWLAYAVPDHWIREMRLSHGSGVGEISYSERVHGPLAFVARNWFWLLYLVPFLST